MTDKHDPRKQLTARSFERLRDRVYAGLIRLERGMPGARENLLSILEEAWKTLDETQSSELREWMLGVALASVSLTSEVTEVLERADGSQNKSIN